MSKFHNENLEYRRELTSRLNIFRMCGNKDEKKTSIRVTMTMSVIIRRNAGQFVLHVNLLTFTTLNGGVLTLLIFIFLHENFFVLNKCYKVARRFAAVRLLWKYFYLCTCKLFSTLVIIRKLKSFTKL